MDPTREILISLIYYPVLFFGPGVRVGVWTQGCTIRCKGCMSVHTWDFDEKKSVDIKELVKTVNSYPTEKITISGGEPFDQANALLKFLKGIRKTKKDIFLYTGYKKQKIFKLWSQHLEYIDAMVCGPFIQGKESSYIYKGSENQELVIINKRLKGYYEKYAKKTKSKNMQIIEKKGIVYIIGIPYSRDIKEIKNAL